MAAAMELASCTVCLDTPMKIPIYQCYNGHLLCRECEPRLVNCPTCTEPLPKTKRIRNRAIEQMQPPMMCCKNSDHGCDAGFYDTGDLENHNRDCTKTSAEATGQPAAARTNIRRTITVSSDSEDDYNIHNNPYNPYRVPPVARPPPTNVTVMLDSDSESDDVYGGDYTDGGSDVVEIVSGDENENDGAEDVDGHDDEDARDDFEAEESNGEESEFDEENEEDAEDSDYEDVEEEEVESGERNSDDYEEGEDDSSESENDQEEESNEEDDEEEEQYEDVAGVDDEEEQYEDVAGVDDEEEQYEDVAGVDDEEEQEDVVGVVYEDEHYENVADVYGEYDREDDDYAYETGIGTVYYASGDSDSY